MKIEFRWIWAPTRAAAAAPYCLVNQSVGFLTGTFTPPEVHLSAMDMLFAAHLGETAVVQVHACDDDDGIKGKGVFALVRLAPADVALTDRPLAFLPSRDLTAAAITDKVDVNARLHTTCAGCGWGSRGFGRGVQGLVPPLLRFKGLGLEGWARFMGPSFTSLILHRTP